MKRFSRLRPSPAMIVAVIALVVAASGGAMATGLLTGRSIKNGSLTGLDIKNGSITGNDVKARSLAASKLTPAAVASLRGQKGAPGAKGAQGSAGEAVAYARVAANGTLEPGDGGKQNKNVIAVDIQRAAAGVYCFGGLPFAVASAMVSPDSAGDMANTKIASVAVQRGITLGTCDAGHQQARVSMVTPAGVLTDHRFQVWFEATGGSQIQPGVGGD